MIQGPRESDNGDNDGSEGGSDAVLELRDPPRGLGCRDSVQMKSLGKGGFGRLRGGEGKERWRFRPKLQRLLTPLPPSSHKAVGW